MKKIISIIAIVSCIFYFGQVGSIGFNENINFSFNTQVDSLKKALINIKLQPNINNINKARIQLKKIDFLLRYLHEVEYKKINGVMPIEWETEVYEKWKTPYRREGGGLFLAYAFLEENNNEAVQKQMDTAIHALDYYLKNDTIQNLLKMPSTYLFANRLFLLNLSSIYTTGFENPNKEAIIPELKFQMEYMKNWYSAYNSTFNEAVHFDNNYLALFEKCNRFLHAQSNDFTQFNHFVFIQKYINPMFAINQSWIEKQHLTSTVLVDYSLNVSSKSIFDKTLYEAQQKKGIYNLQMPKEDETLLSDIGKTLFYDPILSGNNKRSCANCHSPQHFLQDGKKTALHFDSTQYLSRNSPSLCNIMFQHLLHIDGKHQTTLQQAKGVTSNPDEMNSAEIDILNKIKSIPLYKKSFDKLQKYTTDKHFSMQHIASALTFYYSQFSFFRSDFDAMIDNETTTSPDVEKGFNIFMSKAQCATCHFLPQFNGVKPPFNSSEFEVLGTPESLAQKSISIDKGRYTIHKVAAMENAFRTPTLRNVLHTAPYMHNGVFNTIDEVLDFYNNGGGANKYMVANQTLSNDSLQLNKSELQYLKSFLSALNENIPTQIPPLFLPLSKNKTWNERKVGGAY